MNQASKSIMKWNLSLAETLAFGCTVAILTFWAVSYFQSKDDAKEMKMAIESNTQQWKSSMESRIGKIETDVSTMRTSMELIGRDVSYIRGRIEPKTKNVGQ